MDFEEMRDFAIFALAIVIICLSVVIPICLCCSHIEDRKIELEKYKIEIQLKHGDINIESEDQ